MESNHDLNSLSAQLLYLSSDAGDQQVMLALLHL